MMQNALLRISQQIQKYTFLFQITFKKAGILFWSTHAIYLNRVLLTQRQTNPELNTTLGGAAMRCECASTTDINFLGFLKA